MQEYTIPYHLSKQGKTVTMTFRFSGRQLTVLGKFCRIFTEQCKSHDKNLQDVVSSDPDKRFLQNLAYNIAKELYPVSAGYNKSNWGKPYTKTQPWNVQEGLQRRCLLATGHLIPEVDFKWKYLQEVAVTPASSPINMFTQRGNPRQNSKPLTGSQRRALKRQQQLRQKEEKRSNIPRKC